MISLKSLKTLCLFSSILKNIGIPSYQQKAPPEAEGTGLMIFQVLKVFNYSSFVGISSGNGTINRNIET
jgi:hypothetical protein